MSKLSEAIAASRPMKVNRKRRRGETDPTRTTGIQRAFVRAANKRLNQLQKYLIASVKTNNAFGLKTNAIPLGASTPQLVLNPSQFANERDTQKLSSYEAYVASLIGTVFLYNDLGQVFSDEFVEAGFKKGSARALTEWEKAGGDLPAAYTLGPLALRTPLTDQASMVKKRAKDAIEGDATKLQNRLNYNFGQALTSNATPTEAARGIRQAITTAKKEFERTAVTEVVRGFNIGNVSQMEALGVTEVRVVAEWKTAGDDRVCQACQSLEGKIFPIDVIRGLIPLHPRCRCAALPILNPTPAQSKKVQTTLTPAAEKLAVNRDEVRAMVREMIDHAIPAPIVPQPGKRGARGFEGADGQQGKRGPRGFDGIQGEKGEDGIDGVDGKDGKDGEKGDAGKRGARGFTGADGRAGRDGIDGKDGKDGRDGKDGKIGYRGMRGRPGADGKRGRIGPRPDHEFKSNEDGSLQLRFQKPDGNWGDWSNLRTNEITPTPDGMEAYEYDGNRLRFKSNGAWGKWIPVGGGGGGTTGIVGVNVEQDGSSIIEAAKSLNFSGGVTVTDQGDGTASIEIDSVSATYLNYFHIIEQQVVTIPERVQSLIAGQRRNEGELVVNGEAVEI